MTPISVTIPNEYNALIAAAKMLNELADGLNITFEKEISPATESSDDFENDLLDDSEKVTVTGVELDSAGRPWDSRIHSSKKKKKQKDGEWKIAKNMDKSLVKKVEAELDATMVVTSVVKSGIVEIVTPVEEAAKGTDAVRAVTPATLANNAPPPPAAVVEPETIYVVNNDTFTADQLREFDWTDEQIAQCNIAIPIEEIVAVITFPDFAGALTKAGISHDDPKVVAAIKSVNGTSFQMLAARPDLIPAVYKEIFG